MILGKRKGPEVTNSVQIKRKAAKLTQQDLATALGVTRQTIISIEQGRYIPSLPLSLKIAQHFNTTVEDIFSL